MVKCRKADQQLVQKALEGATSQIKEKLGPVNFKLDSQNFLAAAPDKNGSSESDSWCAASPLSVQCLLIYHRVKSLTCLHKCPCCRGQCPALMPAGQVCTDMQRAADRPVMAEQNQALIRLQAGRLNSASCMTSVSHGALLPQSPVSSVQLVWTGTEAPAHLRWPGKLLSKHCSCICLIFVCCAVLVA